MSKQVTIHLARRVTLNRAGHDAVELQAGRNVVDADVAAHPFVKAHTVDAGPDHGAELDELRAKLAELSAKLGDAHEEIEDRGDAIKAALKERDAAVARVADLEEQLAQKAADMDALIASIPAPAVEAKSAKSKA